MKRSERIAQFGTGDGDAESEQGRDQGLYDDADEAVGLVL